MEQLCERIVLDNANFLATKIAHALYKWSFDPAQHNGRHFKIGFSKVEELQPLRRLHRHGKNLTFTLFDRGNGFGPAVRGNQFEVHWRSFGEESRNLCG